MSKKPNIIQRIGKVLMTAGTWRPQTMADMDRWMDGMAGGFASSSGANVSGDTAINFSAFFSGVFQICQTIASCKLTLYKDVGENSRKQWESNPVYRLLKMKSNDYMNAFTWKERMQYYALVWGNGYSFIQRDNAGRPIALWPLNPENTNPKIVETADGKKLVYEYRAKGIVTEYRQDQIFHLPGFGFDSVKGYSLLEIAREVIGLGLSQQEFSNRFLSNGAHLGGLLTTKKALGPEARSNLKASFKEMQGGVSNAGGFAVLEEDMDYKPLGMPLADAQFLESKVFQIGEIARILNISPYKLKDYSKATFSNIEHLGIEYATDTIRPWAERWEAAIDTQLLSEGEYNRGFAEFDLNSIQRGDTKTMNEAYNMARNGGWMNANEIRYIQGMNPISDDRIGSMYWRPMNMDDASREITDKDSGSEPKDSDISNPDITQSDDIPIKIDLKQAIDAYGIGVRGGVFTPQPEDEDYFRALASLPVAGEAIKNAWIEDGGVRRPITLQIETTVADSSTGAATDEGVDDVEE